MANSRDDRVRRESPYLLMALAAIGILGCAVLVSGMFMAQALVPDYHWVSDTISDLAAGEWEIVMDVALYGFAVGLLAVSLAAAHAHLGGAGWSIGVLSLAILAGLVIVIGSRNEYGDSDDDGVVIHIYLVYGLGAFFTLAPLCMAGAIRRHAVWAQRILIGLAVVWAVLCPVFLLSPTSIDGLLERLLGLIACTMVLTLCVVFFQRGHRARHHDDHELRATPLRAARMPEAGSPQAKPMAGGRTSPSGGLIETSPRGQRPPARTSKPT